MKNITVRRAVKVDATAWWIVFYDSPIKKLRSSQRYSLNILWLDTIRSNYIVILQEEKNEYFI